MIFFIGSTDLNDFLPEVVAFDMSVLLVNTQFLVVIYNILHFIVNVFAAAVFLSYPDGSKSARLLPFDLFTVL